MNNKLKNHMLVGINLSFAALICGCAANLQADKSGSKHDGVIYRNPRVYNVEYSFEIFPDPNMVDRDKDLKLWVPIPREWDSQKAVKIVSVEPKPHAKYVDPEYGNSMLFWDFGKEPEKPSYKVHLKYRLEQYDVHSSIDPNRVGSYEKTSRYYALYTRSTNTVTITDKVRTLAKTAVGDEKNPYLQAKRIYDFVRDRMYYRKPVVEGPLLSVETILTHPVIDPKTGQEHYLGACYHQSMVFVALCRAVGIPARSIFAWHDARPWIRATPENPEPTVQLRKASVHGLTISGLSGFAAHAWAEIYVPYYGWIPADPTYGRFGNSTLNNKVLIITKGRDVQIDPHALADGDGDYRVIMAPLHESRADVLLWGVFHSSTVRKEQLNHPDPFPADALAEYAAKLYPETEAAKNLGLYRRRTLRWIDEHTREHTDKAEGLAQAYKAESRARYDHEAFICHMLRKIVGDKKFFEIVETYTDLRVKSGEPVSTARFQNIAEEVYGQPLDWFFKQWIEYTELPQLQLHAVTFSENEKGWHVHGTLRQLNKSLFRLPVELVLETEKAPEHKTFWVENRDTAFEFQTAHKPKDVLVDPNNDILQIRKMSPLLESSSYDEIAFCTITDQDKADWFDWTPLHFAAEAGQKDIAEYLIAAGADLDAENIRGETPLQFAADKDHKEVVELLIEKGADVSLHLAARLGDLARVKSLIEEGADVNAKDIEGETPLHIAAAKGHKEVAELLIAKGAEVSSIYVAARIGASAHVAAFLEEGTDINAKDASGQTALHHAARAGYKEIVELLLAHGADVNIGEDSYNRTAAEFAMNGGHDKIVELLISKGADIPPLHLALYAKDKSKARSLIEGGADVNKRTGYGTTPLHRAVSAGYTGIVELLIDKGADVNAKDNWSWTPLHTAVYQSKDMVELLIAEGANLNARDGNGRSALSYAQEEGHTEIVELLRKHGAKE